NINSFSPRSGRQIKENGQVANVADQIEAIYNALVVNKNAGILLSGSLPAGTNNIGKVDLEGATINATIDTSSTMRTPINGTKTVTGTTAELFAGASRLAGRRKMVVKNESADIRIRIGSVSVTSDKGFPVEPGGVFHMDFNPSVDVPIYAASEAGNIQVEVMEV
uniref:hypothetical protein n=1 Tax=Mycobacteroides abscessus TaxID=36809 RepID=UPI0012FFEA2D